MAKAPTITNRILLQHIQGMRTSLEKRMDRIEIHMGRMEHELKENTRDIKSINNALQRLYTHRVSMLGRIKTLEEVVGIAQQ